MPRKKSKGSAATTAAAEIAEVNGESTVDEDVAESDAPSASSTGSSSSSRGPTLVWSRDRDHALVEAVNEEMTSAEIVEHLSAHEAFSDLPEGAVTAVKVTNRLSLLRGRGVEVPRLSRGARYSPDVDELNDLLA